MRKRLWAEKKAQWVKCVLCKHLRPAFSLQCPCPKPGMAAHPCCARTETIETGGFPKDIKRSQSN